MLTVQDGIISQKHEVQSVREVKKTWKRKETVIFFPKSTSSLSKILRKSEKKKDKNKE